MGDLSVTAGTIRWDVALTTPGGLDLLLSEGLDVTSGETARFEEAYAEFLGANPTARVSQQERLAEAGLRLAELRRGGANGDLKPRFAALLRGIAKELRTIRYNGNGASRTSGHPRQTQILNHIDDVIGHVEAQLREIDAELWKQTWPPKNELAAESLTQRKTELLELGQDMIALKMWIAGERKLDVAPLIRRILSSNFFLEQGEQIKPLRAALNGILLQSSPQNRPIREDVLKEFAAE